MPRRKKWIGHDSCIILLKSNDRHKICFHHKVQMWAYKLGLLGPLKLFEKLSKTKALCLIKIKETAPLPSPQEILAKD